MYQEFVHKLESMTVSELDSFTDSMTPEEEVMFYHYIKDKELEEEREY